ncbi:MAG: ABC transporter substrate-binding protein [Liquorilactobacillus hordei]|uniref:ABC transporter substrate-binding protein n=1 Tax=Liquorilactobacillus hordei TaxID=468911 RepID=UPI0039E79F5C
MKKLNIMFFGIILLCLVLFIISFELEKDSSSGKSDKVVNIFNWGDYIDPKLITKFEKQTGYKVSYETFDSNEAMYTKIKQGGTAYDIAIPSDYTIKKMINNHLLLPINHSKLKGLSNIDSKFLNLSFDPGNKYSLPYFWGTLGIIYNKKYVNANEVKKWNDLWNPKFKNSIMLIDGAREVMGLTLNSQGKSVNDTDPKDLQAAYEKLKKLSPNVKAILADEIKVYMAQDEAPIAVSYSGEAMEMMDNNKNLRYTIPEEGSNIWFDNMVIPKTAKNVKGAYAFLNFMLEPKNAAQNAEYVAYATPNKAAKKLLPKSMQTDKVMYPTSKIISHLEVYNALSQKNLSKYNDLFLQFKMH